MLTFYKPTKKVTGALLTVSFNAKVGIYDNGQVKTRGDKSVYFSFVAQSGWNEETQNGVFSGGKKCNLKFSDNEVAGMLAAIKRNSTLAEAMNVKMIYHDGDKSASTINFGPYFKKVKDASGNWVESGNQAGFSIRVSRTDKETNTKENFGLALTWAETERFASFLTTALNHINESLRAEEIKKMGSRKPVDKKKEQPKSEPEDVPDDSSANSTDDPDW
ncbi:MAG: hypothetical protein Q8O88_04510 [bacterium]|nr:hypothetical protein [bacterium]